VDDSNRGAWRPPGYRQVEQRPTSTGEDIEPRSAATGEDIEFALHAAERLLAEVELARRHERMTSLCASTAIALILASSALLAALLSDHLGTTAFKVFVAIATLAFLITLPICLSVVLRARRRYRSTYLRLSLAQDIATMLGEVLSSVAESENWSYVRLEATKLRLSAFPLSKD
jgi:hypothetical protein